MDSLEGYWMNRMPSPPQALSEGHQCLNDTGLFLVQASGQGVLFGAAKASSGSANSTPKKLMISAKSVQIISELWSSWQSDNYIYLNTDTGNGQANHGFCAVVQRLID